MATVEPERRSGSGERPARVGVDFLVLGSGSAAGQLITRGNGCRADVPGKVVLAAVMAAGCQDAERGNESFFDYADEGWKYTSSYE